MDVVFKTEFTGTSPVPVSSDTSSAQSYDPGADYAMAFYEGTTAITKKEDFEEKATCIYDAGTTHVTPDALYVDCGPYTTLDRGGGGLDVGQPMDSSPTSQSITLLYDQKMSLSHPISKHQPSKPIHKADPNFAAADSNSSTPSKTFVPCKVCGDKASGYHYGVTSCEGCKGFFRRSIQKQIEYRCLRDGKCLVIRLNRNRCQFCRFKKCISVGMSRDSVRYGRVPKRTRQQSEEARVTQSEADQSTRDMENKQLAIYDIILTISQAHHANCAYTEEKTRGLVRKLAVFSLNDGSPSDGEDVSGAADSLEQQKIVMWQHFAMFVTPSIQRVVEFSKRVPGFSDLSQDDQLILIKCGFLEVWIVHVSRMINNMDNTLTFNDGSYITRQQMDLMFDDEFTSLLFNFSVQFNAMQLNDTELGLFSAIVVLTSDRPGITDQKHIEQHQDKLMEALKLQVARNHVNDALAFSTLLMKVPELRTLGSKHAEHLNWFRQNWAKLKLPPLYAEIFDIPKSEEDLQYI